MTPEQAIDLLDQAVQQIQASRMTHIKLQECINVLKETCKNKVKGKE